MLKAALLAAALATQPALPPHAPEEPVEPYVQANANAGATPFAGEAMLAAFHGREGIARIVDGAIDRSVADPRMKDIFAGHDLVRLRRTVKEQLCYILNGGCDYTGRDMKTVHRDMGLQNVDFNRFVEHLQVAMDQEGVRFRDQNRLLAKLAPMQRLTVER